MRWCNNNCCSKVKLCWKLIFLVIFLRRLSLSLKLDLIYQNNRMSNQLIGYHTCVAEWSFNNWSGWLVIPKWFILSQYSKDTNKQICKKKKKIPNLAAVKLHRKTIDVQSFLKLATRQNPRKKMKQKMIIIGVL